MLVVNSFLGDEDMIKEFKNDIETTKFTLRNYEKYALSMLTKTEANLIGSIQSHQLYRNRTEHDDKCIDAIEKCFKNVPPIPFDIVAWRAGDMKCHNRPFVPATFLKEAAYFYAHDDEKKIHKIILKKGSKIFPLRALGKDYGDGEAEIIIETANLKKRFRHYIYK